MRRHTIISLILSVVTLGSLPQWGQAAVTFYTDRVAWELATGQVETVTFDDYTVVGERLDLCTDPARKACIVDIGQAMTAVTTSPTLPDFTGDGLPQLSIYGTGVYELHPSQGLSPLGNFVVPGEYEHLLHAPYWGANVTGAAGLVVLRVVEEDGTETDFPCLTSGYWDAEQNFCGVIADTPIIRVVFLPENPEVGTDLLLDDVATETPLAHLAALQAHLTSLQDERQAALAVFYEAKAAVTQASAAVAQAKAAVTRAKTATARQQARALVAQRLAAHYAADQARDAAKAAVWRLDAAIEAVQAEVDALAV
jgi:hypothetical protein